MGVPMPDVYVRLSTKPVARTMSSVDTGVNVDLDERGELVGVELIGAVSVTWDGREIVGSDE